MLADPQRISRKKIIAWYDSEVACLIVIVCMLFVFLFGFIGISTAGQTSAHRAYIWVPVVLSGLSLSVIVSTVVRLIRRFANRLLK